MEWIFPWPPPLQPSCCLCVSLSLCYFSLFLFSFFHQSIFQLNFPRSIPSVNDSCSLPPSHPSSKQDKTQNKSFPCHSSSDHPASKPGWAVSVFSSFRRAQTSEVGGDQIVTQPSQVSGLEVGARITPWVLWICEGVDTGQENWSFLGVDSVLLFSVRSCKSSSGDEMVVVVEQAEWIFLVSVRASSGNGKRGISRGRKWDVWRWTYEYS